MERSTPPKAKKVSKAEPKKVKGELVPSSPPETKRVPRVRKPVLTPKVIEEQVEKSITMDSRIDTGDDRLLELLEDEDKLRVIDDFTKAGWSLGTLAGMLDLKYSTLRRWVLRGRDEHQEKVHSAYVELWVKLSKGWSVARGLAESTIAKIDPKFFLMKGPGKLLGDDWEDDAVEEETEDKHSLVVAGAEFITALKSLRKQGLDLNQIIDNDMLSINTQVDQKVQTVEETVGIGVTQGLPGPLEELVQQADKAFGLVTDNSNGRK
jgi:hypothetical protein